MGRRVRIVGHADEWEVIGETLTSMVLVNPAARQRRDLEALRQQLSELEAEIARTTGEGHAIDGP